MIDALRQHWPEYLMEAAELGLFMISACAFTVLLYHPTSPIAANVSERSSATSTDGNRDGLDRDRNYLFRRSASDPGRTLIRQ